jgi:NAD(P)-dependent dehydrogenase (short-subunit alcohol dehydrogenase family)
VKAKHQIDYRRLAIERPAADRGRQEGDAIGRSHLAAIVAFVAGPEASYITGASLTVDGGTNS